MKNLGKTLWLLIPVFVMVLVGCAPVPRGEWVWDVPEIGTTQPTSTTEEQSTRTTLRIYDVSDLIGHGWKNIEGLSPGGSWNCFPDPQKPPPLPPAPGRRPLNASDLVSLIQIMVDCENWREAGGEVATAQAYGSLLIIRQTSQVHQEIEALLSTLRAASKVK